MAGEHLVKQKQYRIEELTLEGKFDRAERIVNSDTYSPLFQNQFFHPEAEPVSEEINDDLADILNDLFILEGEFVILAQNYQSLLEDSIRKIDSSRREVMAAREKIMDLNMICGEDSGFFQVTTLTNDFFEAADVINEDNTITAKPTGSAPADCEVIEVTGNGIEGNEYVFAEDEFVYENNFTGAREYLTDNNVTTIYEYQKINADKNEPYLFSDLSYDGTEAHCTLTIKSDEPISSVKIISPDNEIILREVQVSTDNEEYISVMTENIKFNRKEDMYHKSQYVYESGIIAFPLSKYIKITLASDGYTSDKIAFLHEYLE